MMTTTTMMMNKYHVYKKLSCS